MSAAPSVVCMLRFGILVNTADAKVEVVTCGKGLCFGDGPLIRRLAVAYSRSVPPHVSIIFPLGEYRLFPAP